jgi:NAD(P)-dependent dehydrogenase (short-subunit alcohol dehydrogenase family)
MNNKMKVGLGVAAGIGTAIAVAKGARRTRYSFRDKVVLITGGSRGLGLALARRLAAEGARLVLAGRNPGSLARAAQELTAAGADVIAVECDVQNREQVNSTVETAVEAYGTLDVVVNNAGIMQVGPLDHMDLEDFRAAMATHAWGPLYVTLAALPHMRHKGSGRIVNISSIGGKLAVPHMLPYSMSKFALAGLSEGLSAELRKHNILVTSVYPGLMRAGSHVNAWFKGNNQSEFAWFAAMAGNPLLSIDLDRAADQIVEACRRGQAQLVITTQAKLAVMFNGLFPGVMAKLMSLTNRVLPNSVGTSPNAVTGWESSSKWAPSILTKLADAAIQKNNEAA